MFEAANTPVAAKVVAAPSPTPAAPAVERPLAVGSLVSRATLRQLPVYPPDAVKAGVSGAVRIYLQLDESGAIAKVLEIGGPAQLHAAALEAARAWRFAPTIVNGKPVRVIGYLTFKFTTEIPEPKP